MSTDYRYAVRNVAQKEIYDSYMGILRISPNYDANGKMIDDPTNFLNTIGYDKIQLSSSNGDPLPAHFIPYAFTTPNVYFNEKGNITRETKDIINICTDTTLSNVATGNIFVCNEFIARSSLHLLDSDNKKKSKIAIAYGCQNTDDNQKADCKGILLYPIESPNDSTYFNNKNKLELFNSDNSKPRTQQVEESLLEKSQFWYNTTINSSVHYTDDKNINPTGANETIESHRVKVNNQYINHFNNNNEEIPVLYTRDYVLGHYEGHSQRTNDSNRNAMKSHYLPTDSQIYEAEETDNVTKLSWIRFDNLIWECLDEVLAGKIRHKNGRYNDLGTYIGEKGNSIVEELFGMDSEEVKMYSNLYPSENPKQFLDYTAPLVGNGVQEGMIMYHTMPFHRYWFHRCRQVLFNMEEFKEQYKSTYPELSQLSAATWEDMNLTEKQELQEFYNNDLLTPCCKASITPHHSLVKDFLLCNGQDVNLTNFPNISLNNGNLLKDSDKEGSILDLVKGKQATPNPDKCFYENTDWKKSSTHYALKASSTGDNGCIKLPNLFNFHEKYPRFIRGLNWTADTKNIQDFSESNKDEFIDKSLNNNTNRMAYIDNDSINTRKNVWGEYGKCIVKNFTSVDKPYYFSFDYLTPKNSHRHLLFAKKKSSTEETNEYTTLVTFKYQHTGLGTVPDGVNIMPILNSCYCDIPNGNVTKTKKVTYNLTTSASWTEWYDYNFNNTQIYKHFQPIHTAGMYYFNKNFTNLAKTVNENNDYIKGKKDDKTVYWLNDKEWKIENKWHYYDATGKKHMMNVAKISTTSKDIYDGNHIDFDTMDQYRFERNKRKQLIIKLNESEGISPISVYGGPRFFQTKQKQTWERKRTSLGKKRWDKEHGDLYKMNVAGYNFNGNSFQYGDSSFAVDNAKYDNDGNFIKETGKKYYHWRTLTSLQYWNCEKLGVGNIENIDKEKYLKKDTIPTTASDYYDYHNVTDIWRETSKQKSEELTYGSTTVKVDTSAPYPSFLNLIPLIRL